MDAADTKKRMTLGVAFVILAIGLGLSLGWIFGLPFGLIGIVWLLNGARG